MSLPSFETSAYVLAAFMLVYGFLFLFLSRTVGNGEAKFLSIPTFLLMFSILYFAMSHYSVYAALIYDTNYALKPACDYLPNSSTTLGSVTTYDFVNTCRDDVYPEGQLALTKGYGWVLYLDLATLMLGSFFLIMARIIRKF